MVRVLVCASISFVDLTHSINAVMTPSPRREKYAHAVVYLGQASLTKYRLLELLTAHLPLGLAIYGLGWDRFDEDSRFAPAFAQLLPAWRGVLPKDDIAALYSSASVVLGTTEVSACSARAERICRALSSLSHHRCR